MFRICVRYERKDMSFIVVFIVYLVNEVFFHIGGAGVWLFGNYIVYSRVE